MLPVASDKGSSEPRKNTSPVPPIDTDLADSRASRDTEAVEPTAEPSPKVDIETAETPPVLRTSSQSMDMPEAASVDADTNEISVDGSDATSGESPSTQDNIVAEEPTASAKTSKAELEGFDTAADDLPTHASWCDFFEELQLKGVIHSVVSHFELDCVSGRTLYFKIAEQNATLYNERHISSLAATISDAVGNAVEVAVTVAPTGELTPFRQREFKERARVEAAEQALGSDEALATLLTEFDAEVVPGTVRPPLVEI